MSLSITWSEPATVNTGGTFLASGGVYDSGHDLTVYLGFTSPASLTGVQTATGAAPGAFSANNTSDTKTFRAIAYASTLGAAGRLVIVGNGAAGWSDDGGVTWTAATSLPEANNWVDVKWWPAQSIFVMVAANGVHRVGTSSDGKSWTMQSAAAAKSWSGVEVSATVAVAVTNTNVSSTQQVMTSADGATWALQTHADITTNRGTVSSATRHGIGYSPDLDMFLITGTDTGNITKAYRSVDDGVTWTASSVIPTITNSTNRGYYWLASAGSWYMSVANQHYGESTDGDTWTITDTSGDWTNSGYTPMWWDDASGTLVGGSTLGFDNVLVGLVTVGTVTGITPSTGTKRGNTFVTISGTMLSGVAQGDVLIGGSAALSVSPAADGLSLTCLTPAHAVGPVDVTITGIGTLTDGYTYVSVDRVTPGKGAFTGGSSVTITGYGFNAATGVTFGGSAATNVVIVSNTTITATTPVHGSGFVDVVVLGVDTLTDGYEYSLSTVTLPPIPYRTPPTDGTATGLIAQPWVKFHEAVKRAIEDGPATTIPAESVVGVFQVDQIPDLPWDQILKSGSSLADLETRSASDLSSGTLANTRLATVIPRAFAPGSFTVPADNFVQFVDHLQLNTVETATVLSGAIVRIV